MTEQVSFNFFDASGANVEAKVSLDDYKEADAKQVGLFQLMNSKYSTDTERYGSVSDQAMRSSGMFLSHDRENGYKPPTLHSYLNGNATLNSGAITRPDGALAQTPAGRIFFPALMIEIMDSNLRENHDGYLGAFNDMVGQSRSLDTQRYDQVIINHDAPRNAVAGPVAQLAVPNRILSITTSDVSRNLPVYGVTMEISDQAAKAATLDLVAIAYREAMREEMINQMERDIAAFVNGDTDTNQTALSSFTAQSLDAAITTAGNLTQKAWIKFLRLNYRKRNISHILCSNLDVYLAIEGRTGRPTRDTDTGVDERLNTTPRLNLAGINQNVPILALDDTAILGANVIVGIDKSKALRRVTYVGAAYSAIEEFVLSRKTAMRIDWSSRVEQAGYSEAFSKMTLTV